MRQIFSVVLDIQLDFEPIQTNNEEIFTAVIPSKTIKAIQSKLENSIEIREPSSGDTIVKLCDPKKIIKQIEFLSTIETNLKEVGSSIQNSQQDINYPNIEGESKKFLSPVVDPIENSPLEMTLFLIQEEETLFGFPDALRQLTKHEAQKMRIFPLQIDQEFFTCAMISRDPAIINKLRLRTGKKIVSIIAPLRIILNSIEKSYRTNIDTADRNALLSSIAL